MRIAILGAGKQAPRHIRGFRGADPAIELLIADQDPDRAEALGQQEGLETIEVARVFGEAAIDAVVIATPTITHVPLARLALESGKHFLVEKPLAQNAADAEALARQARESGTIGMVGYLYRSVPVFGEIHRLLVEGSLLGPAHLALFRIGGRGSHQPWKHRRLDGGGVENEMLVHMLDMALWFFGEPDHASLLVRECCRPKREIAARITDVDADDLWVLRLDYQAGPLVIIEADFLTPGFSQWVEIEGSEGGIRASIESGVATGITLLRARAGYAAGTNPIRVQSACTDPYVIQANTFLAAITSRCPPTYGRLDESVRLQVLLETLTAQGTPACAPERIA